MATPTRPPVARKSSRVPGGFDNDDDLSPIKTSSDFEDDDFLDSSPVPTRKNAKMDAPGEGEDSMNAGANDTFLQEKEMRRKLEDYDSTFLQTVSPVAAQKSSSVPRIFSRDAGTSEDGIEPQSHDGGEGDARVHTRGGAGDDLEPNSPITPPHMYRTPAPERQEQEAERPNTAIDDHYNTSSLETMSSSPTAAAAARTVSRAVSGASTDYGHETIDDSKGGIALEQDTTPKRRRADSDASHTTATPTAPAKMEQETDNAATLVLPHNTRPQYSNHRMASNQSTYSSYTTTSTEDGSDATLGADFALQSGGAVPERTSLLDLRRPTDFSRSISLGSIASGISGTSDEEKDVRYAQRNLQTLDEEDTPRVRGGALEGPQTPGATSRDISTPTDTVIAQRAKDVEVPPTLAREYRNRQRQPSPEKRNGPHASSATRHGKNLTLKEQSGTIDRLVKENFDLKLKITFLDEALNRRSEEGIKEMISENVDLRTAKFKSAKESRELKRTMRDLERKNKELSDDLHAKAHALPVQTNEDVPDPEAVQELEEEVTYLRERILTYETEMETMRSEKAAHDFEKKKMAEVVRRFGDGRGMDVGETEEVELWKDLLEAETARREQADEENRRLREELRRLKSDASSATTNDHAANAHHVTNRHQKMTSTVSYNDNSDRGSVMTPAQSASSSTLVDQLRADAADMRREIAAQFSMLQSRNKERQRLQDEIEGLKLGSRRGDGTRSIAGDSIFERSISRAQGRPQSRASGFTQMSDPEREALEFKNGELRDHNAKLRLEVHDLTTQMDQLLDEIEGLDGLKVEHQKLQQLYDNDIAEATDDLQNLSRERDEALRLQEDMEQELQDLRAEGSEKIGALEEELDQKNQEMQELQNDLSNHAEDAEALRREVRTLSERIIGLEEEVAEKSKKIRSLQLELEEMGHESDALDKDLREEKEKNTKLSVQLESGQNEISFLREEQDGDKIKIGDLEDALKNLRDALHSEKDRAKELDARIAEERHQRETIASKEKSEVQSMMNDLNRDLSTSKDEGRKLKKNLHSKEIETTTFKERLLELENHLKEVLGEPNGTRPTFLVAITKLQKELESTAAELENAQHHLSEKDRLLQNRDALLESHGLESKKLSDLLERERQGRRQDKVQHEQWQKTHQHTSRTVSQKDVRITELESSRQTERKKVSALESQFKDQLAERNTLLLTLWNRVSSLCGSEWKHQNSLINNHLPTLDVVANSSMLPSFSRTLLSAVTAVEGTIVSFQSRIRAVEREMKTEYQSLEHTLDARIKKLDRLESTVQSHRISGTFTAAPEIAKLRGENRLLKSEIATLQKQEMLSRKSSRTISRNGDNPPGSAGRGTDDAAPPPPRMARHHSYAAVEHLTNAAGGPISPTSRTSSMAATRSVNPDDQVKSAPIEPSQQRWIHRLRELERRLKAEREARLLDRSGARKRLEEGAEENRRLKGELERERVRRGLDPAGVESNRTGSAGTG